MKTLMENFQRYTKSVLKEEADPSKLDPSKFPLPLSKVHPSAARTYVKSGEPELDQNREDDTIPVTPKDSILPAKSLKPSQTSMNMKKAMAFVIQMLHPKGKLKPGGNLGAFVSQDKFIMDGHHRWIATGMIDPTLSLGGYYVEWPGKQLVAVLNTITKGKLGIMKGKPASGGFDQFQESEIRKWLNTYLQEGVWDNLKAEDVQGAIENWTQQQGDAAVEAAVEKMLGNLGQLTLSAPSWAPEREDMPVIDKDQVSGADAIAVDALKTGKVDVNPPYGADAMVKKARKTKAKGPNLPKDI